MAVISRRQAVVVDVGGVKVGGTHPIVVQSMTNTDTADTTSTVNQVMALATAGSELVRVTVNTEQAAAAVPKIVECLYKFGVRVPIIGDFHYNGHLLLKKYPGVCPGAGEVPHQSGQREYRQEARRQFPHHDRGRHRVRQAGADRRELGIARSGAADPHDGRKLPPAGAQGRARGDDGSDRGERHRIGALGRAARPLARPDHPERQGERRAGSDRRVPHAGGALRLCAASRLDRSGPGIEGHRGDHRGARRAAAGGHRRHDPRLAHAAAEWRPHRGSHRLAADPAIASGSAVSPRR